MVLRASPRCANVTTTRFPPRTKARRSRSASESPRAATAGRWASKAYRWPAGSWLELGRAAETELNAELLLHRLARVVRLPDEIRGGKRKDEVVRRRRWLVLEPGLDEVGAALGRGLDQRLVERVQRRAA